MCEECHMTICDCRCPNAPDPPQVFICSGCGEPILEGDDYWDIMGEQWCEEYIDDAKRESKEKLTCCDCEAPIQEGEDYWVIMGKTWCEECIQKAKRVAEYDPY